MSFNPQHISCSLFWEMDYAQLDWEKNKHLIVQRIIERGTIKALHEITGHYGKDGVVAIIKQLPFLSSRDMAFVHIYFDIPLNELKCFLNRPLMPHYLN